MSIQEEMQQALKGYNYASTFSNENLTDLMRNPHLADWMYEKIMKQISEFESKLDSDSEVAVRLASFGSSILMSIEDIGFQNPDLLYFYGMVDGKPAQLIQHINQLNFLLWSVPKLDPQQPARRIAIGFAPPSEG